MRKLRYFYWFFQTFLKKHFLVIIAAALVGALSFNQSQRIFRLLPKPKPSLFIGRVSFEASLSSLPLDIQSLTSDGLTSVQEDGSFAPNLAENWQIIDNGQTYIFHLKNGLRWHDNSPLVAADVNYSFKDVTTEIQGDNTVIFKLKEPFSPFPSIVSQPLFKRTTTPILQLVNKTNIVGTGEYKITKLKYNGNYLEKIILESASERRIYRFYKTEQAALTAFKLAEIDVLEDISQIEELSSWSNVDITQKSNPNRYLAVFFNTENPNLSAKTTRQALTYTIPDKPDGPERSLSPIGLKSWTYNPKVKPYLYSLTDAKELLKDSKTDFTLELTTTPAFSAYAEKIKASWEQLGLTVKLKVTNFPDTNSFEVLLIGQQIPFDPDQYLLWHSTQPTNITRYKNAKVDKLLEDGRKELDVNKREEIYLDFQRFLVEDSPAAFIRYLDSYTITRK